MTDSKMTTPDINPSKPAVAPMPPTKPPVDATKQPADPKVDASVSGTDDKKAATLAQPKT